MTYRVRLYDEQGEIEAPGYVKGGTQLTLQAEFPDAQTHFPYTYRRAPWDRDWRWLPRSLRFRVGALVWRFFEDLLHWPRSYYVYDRSADTKATIRARAADLVDDETGKVIDYYDFGDFHASSHGIFRVILPVRTLA